MLTVFDPRQYAHTPRQEMQDGAFTTYAERATRLDSILSAVPAPYRPDDHGLEPILRVHDRGYVDFLQTIYEDWRAEGRPGDAIPYVFPVVGRRNLALERVDARLGRFGFDMGTPIAEGTWIAAYWGAQTALSGVRRVIASPDAPVFALCRPPGHHAGADYCGGYCYLNNAAIAAEDARAAGAKRVAILDIDYHHGNGTQDIFFDRGDVFFASIHADPSTDYPFYWGRVDERGQGDGDGATLNLPLRRGATVKPVLDALDTACAAIDRFGADCLIVSFGADTYDGDPISHFSLTTSDYPRLAQRIAALNKPTLIVMEGGYAVDALGDVVSSFLSGF